MLVTALRLLFQRAEHDLIEPHIDLHFLRRSGEATEGQFPCEHFVKDDAQGVNVGPVIHELGFLDLLRGHVMRRPHHVARLRQPSRPGIYPYQPGQAEVGDLHPARFVQQDVLRLDVAMNDALVVRELERLANLRHDGQRLARRQLALGQQVPQCHPIDELHQEVVKSLGLAEIVDGHDVRMA